MASQTGQRAQPIQQLTPIALQRAQRPRDEKANDAPDDATWDMADEDLFCALIFVSAGSTFLVIRRFDRKMPHGRQQGRADLREKRSIFSHAELHKINHTKMTPGEDPDEFLYTIGSRRDRLHARWSL